MRHGFLKVAVATPEVRVADCRHNARRIIALIERAGRDNVMLLATPELCTTGYTCGDLFLQDALQNAALEALRQILQATRGRDMLVLVGVPLVARHSLYNCAAVMHDGKLLGIVPKTFLPNYGEFYEKRLFAPAPEDVCDIEVLGQRVPFGSRLLFCCADMPAFTLGVELCEDLWAPAPPSTALSLHGATVIANLSASDEAVAKPDYRRKLVQVQSARLACGYLFCSAGEGESTTDVVFSGHDMICENGAMLAEAPPFGEGYAVTELDLQFLSRERRRHAREAEPSDLYRRIPFPMPLRDTVLTRTYWRTPFVADTAAERERRCDEVLAIQAHGLKKRLAHTGARRAVIGVSGGLDSSLALLVSVRALALLNRPATDVLAVTMPCFGTTKRTRSNAEKLCDALRIPCRTVDITAAVTQHLADIGHPSDVADVTFENAQARERTQVLMDLANMEGGLVVGTGDLSEIALGWCTFSGDHISMYDVNSGVPKTLMRDMLSILARRAGGALGDVLLDILDTPISPELLPAADGATAQRTEDAVGPYALHDFFLYHAVRRGETRDKIQRLAEYAFAGEYDGPTIAHWLDTFYRRFFGQQFKRSCMPDGPRVGNVSLSPRGDWRMPSDAASEIWRE